MLGVYWVTNREFLVQHIFNAGLNKAMDSGYNIVIDNMSNLNPKHIQHYKDMVDLYNGSGDNNIQYELKFKLFNTPVEECIRRDSLREIPIGAPVIRQQWRKYRTYIIQQSIQEMLVSQAVQNYNLPHCIIVDMDATLCFNTNGREFYGEGVNEKLIEDIPNKPIVDIVKFYKTAPYGSNPYKYEPNHKVIIITGRDKSCEQGTIAWLNKYNVPWDILLMREVGDLRKGYELKKELYLENVQNNYYVDFVLEDSSKVVDMYRKELGLTVLQPNEGKF